MSRFSTLVVAPRKDWINKGLSPLRRKTARAALGEPRKSYTDKGQPVTGELLKRHLLTRTVGFKSGVKITAPKPVLDSLERILAKVKAEKLEVWDELDTAGVLCCRKVRGGEEPSIHSWALAIDLTFGGQLDRMGDGLVQKGVMEVYRYFHEEGWYSGLGFTREDGMHFEVADQTLKAWMRQGLISR